MLGESFRQTVCCGSARSHRKIASPPPLLLRCQKKEESLAYLLFPLLPSHLSRRNRLGEEKRREKRACVRTYSLLKEKPVKFSAFFPSVFGEFNARGMIWSGKLMLV